MRSSEASFLKGKKEIKGRCFDTSYATDFVSIWALFLAHLRLGM